LQDLNQFLNSNGFNLMPLSYTDSLYHVQSPPSQNDFLDDQPTGDDLNMPIGKYIFRSSPIGGSTITGFFRFEVFNDTQPDRATANSAKVSISVEDTSEDESNDNNSPIFMLSPTIQLVNLINRNLEKLQSGILQNGVELKPSPIVAASPNWLCAATSVSVLTGSPITPPIPLPADVSCPSSPGLWPITLPELPPDLQSMTGEGVTVFILDTLPKHEQIMQAAQIAGDTNLLLQDVARNVTFSYPVLPDKLDMPGLLQPATGKDIYGRLIGYPMADHGLSIAGIVRDLAPNAHIECIRVFNDSCVGDIETLTNALNSIHNRMLPQGDLYNKPVVINLSLVAMPSDEEMIDLGFNPADITTIEKGLLAPIQSLADLGAVFVTSAGNEGDMRYNLANLAGIRPGASYPAAFANKGLTSSEMIPVGAVDKNGNATTYSCYPGHHGVATYGGDISIPANVMTVDSMKGDIDIDALIGLYTSPLYPALSIDDPQSTYPTPNPNAWAYWIGTSFATEYTDVRR
jgi:hypothetical protein